MTRMPVAALLAVVFVGLVACGRAQEPSPSDAATPGAEQQSERLAQSSQSETAVIDVKSVQPELI